MGKPTEQLSEYDQQAADFLTQTGTKFEAVFLGTMLHFPDDTESRDIYQMTLTNSRGFYSFRFGDSLHNTQRRQLVGEKIRGFSLASAAPLRPHEVRAAQKLGFKIHKCNGRLDPKEIAAARKYAPGAYDVLACLTTHEPGTFADFCSEYGYDEDSRKAFKTFKAVTDEFSGVSRIFTTEQLEQLQEIN